jgi:hypothetical protein
MPDIQITDQLDKPIETVKVDLSQPSSLVKYLKTELLHLAVVPDFVARKDLVLSLAATKPIQFQATATHAFELDAEASEIQIAPAAQAAIRVNATPGANLFDSDPFHAPAVVPDHIGYLSARFQGSLDLSVSASEGDLIFGLDKNGLVSLEYLKAFPLGEGEPTLGAALGHTMACFVIPADLSDLNSLGANDIAAASGHGSLSVSGGVQASVWPNPLASVDLPLGLGAAAVNPGMVAGLTASFTISGSYQMRARRKDADTIELSVLRERGTAWTADFSASAGITVSVGDLTADLAPTLLGAISKDPTADAKLLADLEPGEMATLAGAIKGGLDHSLRASLDRILSTMTDDQAAFQYEIQPALLSAEGDAAVRKALRGDLSLLTAMENGAEGAELAPGVKMLNSVLSETRKRGVELKINLLGILNYVTVSELIRNSEIVHDPVSGDVTIKETVTGNRITALTDPLARNEALRKVLFDSLLATTSYRAGKAVTLPDFESSQLHFALNQNTNHQIMRDYLSWFAALDLVSSQDNAGILAGFIDGGSSTCVLRTSFGDEECASMFFEAGGNLRPKQYYLEIGRQAMRALLDPENQPIDRLRYRIVDDALWPTALGIGANVNLGPLVGLAADDIRVMDLIGDVRVITDWAEAMIQAGALLQDMRAFVGAADPKTLVQNDEFQKKRNALQKKLAALASASRMRFDEPWGMVCLFWAAGSPHTAYAKAATQRLLIERSSHSAHAAGTR